MEVEDLEDISVPAPGAGSSAKVAGTVLRKRRRHVWGRSVGEASINGSVQRVAPIPAPTDDRGNDKDDCDAASIIPGTQSVYIRTWGCSHNNR